MLRSLQIFLFFKVEHYFITPMYSLFNKNEKIYTPHKARALTKVYTKMGVTINFHKKIKLFSPGLGYNLDQKPS